MKEKHNKPLIIKGKSNSGKSTLAKALEEKGYKRIITYTTRPMRPGEIQDVDYHFLSQEEFDKRKSEGFFAETADYDATFGHCSYGSSKESYQEGTVIVLNPYGIKQIKAANINCNVLYLDINDELIRERAIARGDKLEEIERRIEKDNIDFMDAYENSDFAVEITSKTTVKELVNLVEFFLYPLKL